MKPYALRVGDQIGVVAPASPCEPARLKKAVTLLLMMGYQVKVGNSVRERDGYLAGTDEMRAQDLNHMFADQSVHAIFCLRGGYGVTRILPLLDYELIKQHPKIVIGYSDITALHLAINQKTDLTTFHGPVLAELARPFHPLTGLSLFSLCSFPTSIGRYPTSADAYTITAGYAEGRLTGGNLSLISALLSTPYEMDTREKILFLEEVDEAPYRVDRMLTQLLQTGKLHSARGIILACFTDCHPIDPEKSKSLSEIFHDRLGSLGIPVYYGLQAGHCSPNLTLPIGGKVRMDATDCWLTCLESNVIERD